TTTKPSAQSSRVASASALNASRDDESELLTSYTPKASSSTDSPVSQARESLSALRVGLARQLEAVEQRLEEAEARSAEDHHFAADMHAWNLQLLAQQKADQQRIRELEEMCKALMDEKEERGGNGDDSGDNYLPRQEELQTMTRDQLNEVERRQEEYLLTIRKIKISLIR
ncbi:uncharacterized protein ACA1_379510, partial [Acanthamoeba castellanii str. Neff]